MARSGGPKPTRAPRPTPVPTRHFLPLEACPQCEHTLYVATQRVGWKVGLGQAVGPTN